MAAKALSRCTDAPVTSWAASRVKPPGKRESWAKTVRSDARDLATAARQSEDDVESLYRHVPAKFHRVAMEDTLRTLSIKYYGNVSDWRKIYEANEELLGDSTDLIIGMLLEIPK